MDNSRTSNIILVLESVVLVFLLFFAIPQLISSITTSVDPSENNETSVTNMSTLEKDISKDDAAVLVARLGELAQSTPGYVNGPYKAAKIDQKGSGFYITFSPTNGGRNVYAYIESDGFNDSGVYINGRLKNPDYIPNIKQLESETTETPNTVEGFNVYTNEQTDQSQVPGGDR